jgi:hypothetical protein
VQRVPVSEANEGGGGGGVPLWWMNRLQTVRDRGESVGDVKEWQVVRDGSSHLAKCRLQVGSRVALSVAVTGPCVTVIMNRGGNNTT